MHAKAKPPKARKDAHMNGKGIFESQPTHDIDIKCFKYLEKGHIASQCLNRRVMLTRGNEEVKSKSEKMPHLEDCSNEDIAYPIEEEAFVIMRTLNMQIEEDDVDQ